MVIQHAACVPSVPDTAPAYWRFHEAVTRARLLAWLPPGQRLLVDVSGPHADSAQVAAMVGHRVIRVLDDDEGPGSVPMAPSARPGGTDGAIESQVAGPRWRVPEGAQPTATRGVGTTLLLGCGWRGGLRTGW